MTITGYSEKQFVNVPIDQLAFGPNIRVDTGDLDTLISSIKAVGILEPILCCPTETGDGVEVLCGQRRTTAARIAGLRVVPCIIRPRPSDAERVFLQLVENADRKDMSPVEHGDTFLALQAHGYSQQDIARALGRSIGWVSARTMIAGLPDFYRDAVHHGRMTMNFALDIPRSLSLDPEFTRKLAGVAHLGEARMRDFVDHQVHALNGNIETTSKQGPRAQGGEQLMQMFAARLPYSVVQLMRKRAKAEKIQIGVWLEEAILAHARR